MVHEQHINNKNDEKSNDQIINLSDYIPEPKSLYQILKLSDHIKEKWGTAIKKDIVGLFDNHGDMQIKDQINNWSPTALVHLLKCFLADAIANQTKIYFS